MRIDTDLNSIIKTQSDDAIHDRSPPRWSPVIVNPIIGDRESGSELGSIEEVVRVPVIPGSSKRGCTIASGVLSAKSAEWHSMYKVSAKTYDELGPNPLSINRVVGHAIRIS